ncbi:unknown [Bacteroides sp. CAG:598]|nr:unknown [Bacteroides sp. CAG:598]
MVNEFPVLLGAKKKGLRRYNKNRKIELKKY